MSVDIPLNDLTVAEKVQLLERVWENLCQEQGNVRSPQWHQAILDERRRQLENGSATVSTWTEAKARLLNLGK